MFRAALVFAFLVASVTCQCPDGPGLPTINGMCPDTLILQNGACCPIATTLGTTTLRPTTRTNNDCTDLINRQTGRSDCPSLINLCRQTPFQSVLANACPRTCNTCNDSPTIIIGNSCMDLPNVQTGRSDCPSLRNLCNQSPYKAILTTYCPRTCGLCR